MRYSIEPRDRIYVNGYGFFSFTKNMSNKYSRKLLYSAKKSTTDAKKTASKSAIQKIAEATGDLIGTKISDKISKRSPRELHSQNVGKIEIERYISSEKIIDESRLV